VPFIAIDFEASCLPQVGRSFPIEVGIASSEGWSRSWLIRPHHSWAGWHWSAEAEALHGIPLERLHREGLDVRDIAARLREAVKGYDVVADSYFDDGWSRTLYQAAGEDSHVPVRCLAELRAFHEVERSRLAQALANADLQRLRRHQAEDDARWLARLLTEIGMGPEERALSKVCAA